MAKAAKGQRTIKTKSETPNWYDSQSNLKKDIISIAVLFLLVLVLFNQIVFKDMIFSEGGDTAAAHAWGKAGEYLEAKEGQKPIWFPYIFSGMPGFGSLAYIPYHVSYFQTAILFVGKLLFFNVEMSWFVLHYFLAGIFMYLLARYWKFKQIPSLLAAVVFMLSPYAIGLAVHGHGSKMMALTYIPLLLLLTQYVFNKRTLLSIGLLAAAVGTALLTNHVQMVYYGFMLIGLYVFYDIIINIKNEKTTLLKKVGLFVTALIIGFGISAFVYFATFEYSQFSIRGGGEPGVAGGLDYKYATDWSFHPFEMINLLVPSFFGFSTPYYWGWMPFTDTTVYLGIVPLILTVIAFIYRRNKSMLFFGLFSVFVLFVSFGKHFNLFYDLLFNYLPFFDKFRAPSMILHLLPITFGMLAAYGLTFLMEIPQKFNHAKLNKSLLIAMGIIAAILVIGFIGKASIYSALSGSMFVKEGDVQQLQQQYGAQASQVLSQLKESRFNLLVNDYVKFSIISIVSLGIVLLYLNKKIKSMLLGLGLILVLVVDLFIIDTKFIEPKEHAAIDRHFAPDQTVQFLKIDKSQFRIFPLDRQLFMDNTYMYHTIESIGGYSPAKIKIYQEMIDSCLYRGPDPAFPLNMNIINMLNTKYLIAQFNLPDDRFQLMAVDKKKQIAIYLNPAYQPRAFFVNDVFIAQNKTEVFNKLNSATFNSRTTAILEKQPGITPVNSDSVSVNIKSYKTNHIELATYNDKNSLLVLSEVYYPAGWKAYIDRVETEIFKTNYILRSVVLPAGAHNIEFKFDPPIYHIGFTVSHVAWGVTILLILVGLVRLPAIKKLI
ncbi:MAG: YfhO family protein [Bacteroidota bacterium]|nr:YfhO family protein [Bacteroidota bacterium]